MTLDWYLDNKTATFLRLFFFQFLFVSLVSFLSMIIQPSPSWLLHPLFIQKPPDYCVRSNPYNKSLFHATHICYAFLDLTLNVIGAGSGVLPSQIPKVYVFGFGIKRWTSIFLKIWLIWFYPLFFTSISVFPLNQSHILHFCVPWDSHTSSNTFPTNCIFLNVSYHSSPQYHMTSMTNSPSKLPLKMPPRTRMFTNPMVPFLFCVVWVVSYWVV